VHFTARRYGSAVHAMALSVRPSVTSRSSIKMAKYVSTQRKSYDSLIGSLVFLIPKILVNIQWSYPDGAPIARGVEKIQLSTNN